MVFLVDPAAFPEVPVDFRVVQAVPADSPEGGADRAALEEQADAAGAFRAVVVEAAEDSPADRVDPVASRVEQAEREAFKVVLAGREDLAEQWAAVAEAERVTHRWHPRSKICVSFS